MIEVAGPEQIPELSEKMADKPVVAHLMIVQVYS
jgi:hypothetical protein